MKYDALIIGGGPAGSTVALILAKAGWSVAVVEKSSFPRRKVCGEFISASNLALLDYLGVGAAFRNMAGPEIRRVGLFAGKAELAAPMPTGTGTSRAWGQALGRENLDPLLLDAAVRAGATLWQPWTAVEMQRTELGCVCTIIAKDQRKNLAAKVVIAAHGSWERSIFTEPCIEGHRATDLLAFKAHFKNCELAADLMPLLVFPGGYGGMVSTNGGRVNLSCCIRRVELQRCRQRYPHAHAGDAVLDHIQMSCLGVRRALTGARLDGAWLAAGPIRPGIRKHYGDGVFRVGNLAGEAHPIVAEGISMAIQSAWLLSHLLISRQADRSASQVMAEIGNKYANEWKALFATRIRAAASFAHVAMRPPATALCIPLFKRFPALLTWGAHLSGKTTFVAA